MGGKGSKTPQHVKTVLVSSPSKPTYQAPSGPNVGVASDPDLAKRLYNASTDGDLGTVFACLRGGGSVSFEEYGWTASHKAAENGHLFIFIILIMAGADISQVRD